MEGRTDEDADDEDEGENGQMPGNFILRILIFIDDDDASVSLWPLR